MTDEWEWTLTIKPGRKGGRGSGHWGHAGRPGQVGGSVSGSVAMSVRTGRTARERQQEAAAGEPQLTVVPNKSLTRAVTNKVDAHLQDIAERYGMAPNELRAEIEQKLAADLQRPVGIRRGEKGALGILRDGRFRTVFERPAGGPMVREVRAEAEKQGLGYPESTLGYERPVYGYISTGKKTVAHCYGGVEFQLKDEVKNRTTYTFGDSFERFKKGELVGSSMVRPERAAWDLEAERYYNSGPDGIGYIETQIQGGLSLSDVSRIIIHARKHDYPQVVELAREKGIEVVIDKDTW